FPSLVGRNLDAALESFGDDARPFQFLYRFDDLGEDRLRLPAQTRQAGEQADARADEHGRRHTTLHVAVHLTATDAQSAARTGPDPGGDEDAANEPGQGLGLAAPGSQQAEPAAKPPPQRAERAAEEHLGSRPDLVPLDLPAENERLEWQPQEQADQGERQ